MESYLGSKSKLAALYKYILSNIELVCEAALKFDDLDFVKFIKKYGGNPWFFHTRQAYIGLYYTTFLLDNQICCQLCENNEMLMTFIGIGMSPSHITNLIENGINVNYKSGKEQITPLMKACASCNYETVKMLLDAGADPRHRTTRNESALFLAFRKNSDEVYFLIYDTLFQKNPSESELLQYLTWMPPIIQNIIKQTRDDRIMFKIIQRLYHFIVDQWHMNAKDLGYSLEKLANYDHVDELATALLQIGNNRNNSQMIHLLLRILYRQKKTQVILDGYCRAMEKGCRPNVLELYVSYFWRLDEANR